MKPKRRKKKRSRGRAEVAEADEPGRGDATVETTGAGGSEADAGDAPAGQEAAPAPEEGSTAGQDDRDASALAGEDGGAHDAKPAGADAAPEPEGEAVAGDGEADEGAAAGEGEAVAGDGEAEVEGSEAGIGEGEGAGEAAGARRERLKSILESLLFATDKPLTVRRMAALTHERQAAEVRAALASLVADYEGRGIVLGEVAGGWQFRTAAENSHWVQQLVGGKPVRLSRAQLETLAIVAYRQPITRPEIDEIRGVDSGGTLKVLLERHLIRVLGKKEEPGRPLLYGTTKEFLTFFHLNDLRELPTLREYHELSEDSRRVVERLGVELDDLPGKGQIALDDEEGGAGEAGAHSAGAGPDGEASQPGGESEGSADRTGQEAAVSGAAEGQGAGASESATEAESDESAAGDAGVDAGGAVAIEDEPAGAPAARDEET